MFLFEFVLQKEVREPVDKRSLTHFQFLFLNRHTVPILPEGISPFCAQSYTVLSDTLKYFATSSIVSILSSTLFSLHIQELFFVCIL